MGDSPRKKLPPEAYEPIPSDQYHPYVGTDESVNEFTVKAIVLGVIFGILFGFANTYLGLKVGLTVSTSIPIAVITVAVLRAMRGIGGGSTILEHNMAQTVGSASSSLASGIIFTIPALFMWGLDPHLLKIATLALLGGVLGILSMVPLRRLLIRNEHGRLPYPEGTACAEILVASEAGGSMARKVFTGLGVGALFKTCISVLHLWPHKFETNVPGLPKALFGIETTPALLGVGYILGFRISAIMVAGSFISWMVFIPLIAYFGNYIHEPLFPETESLIRDMSPGLIWNRYIRYIGAGGVAFGGILTIVRAFPTMIESFQIGVREIKARLNKVKIEKMRTDEDISFPFLLTGVTLVIGTMIFIPKIFGVADNFTVRVLAAVCIAFFSFFFVVVSARIVGFIGVSSNPTSGMTIVTLIGTSLIFYLLGWTDTAGKAAALTIGTVVCVAASIAGDTSQDLKTGFLLGATPKNQQFGELIGVVTSALAVASAVIVLNAQYSFGSAELPAPQATLMKTVIEGILSADLPWVLVGVGGLMALTVELLGVPSLPFAVGLYLPLSTFSAIFGGGLLRRYIESRARDDVNERNALRERGILYASGLIAGEGLIAVARAAYAYFTGTSPEGFGHAWMGGGGEFVSLGFFLLLGYLLYRAARK